MFDQPDLSIRTDPHTRRCLVCKHPKLKEIEDDFMCYEMQSEIARKFAIPPKSISHHVIYYGLEEKRGANTEKMLKIMLSRGFDKGINIDARLWIECAKELNRLTGARQEDRQNEHDLTPEQTRKLEVIRQRRPEVQQTESVDN